MRTALTLVQTWLLLDFFAESRRTGGAGSTLTTAIFGQSFLALIIAAVLFPDIPPIPYAAANLSLVMLLVGIGTLGGEEGEARRRADRALLLTAPVGGSTIALARALHGAFHIGLLAIGMALPSAILFAFLTGNALLVPPYLALAALLAGLATGGLTVLLQFLRNVLGPARAALIAGTGKALLLGLGLVAFATAMPKLSQTADALPIGRLGVELLPPYQAARFLCAPTAEAPRLLALLGLGLLLLLAAALLRDREPRGDAAVAPDRLGRWHRRRLGCGALLGLTEFVGTMLFRSPGLRVRVLPLLGVPAALVLLALWGSGERARALFLAMAAQFPAIYLPFVIAFLPRADHPGTAWLFDTAPQATLERARAAVFLALCSHLLLPVHLVALPAMLALGVSWTYAVPLAAFALGVAVLTAQHQAQALQCIPFTRADDGQEEVAAEGGAAMGAALLLAAAGAGFALIPAVVQWPVAAVALALGLHRIRSTR